MNEELKQENIIEAVLFTMGRSVDIRQLAAALGTDDVKTAQDAVQRLKERYAQEDRAMEIIELENSYQMCTKKDYYNQLITVAKTPKKQVITDAVMETLSIVAYKQPITRTEIDNIRGVCSDYSINKLVEYGLIYEAGRLDAPGKPVLFATTEEFLRRFGVGSKKALPSIDSDKEAEIVQEVESEVGYRFGFETDQVPGQMSIADVDEPNTAETADSIVEAVAAKYEQRL